MTPNSNSGEILYNARNHQFAKFHHPTFNRSEVILLTDKQTNKDAAENIPLAPLCYAGGYRLTKEGDDYGP